MVVDTSPYPGETCTSDPARPWFRSCPDDPGQAPQPKALLLVGFLNIYLVWAELEVPYMHKLFQCLHNYMKMVLLLLIFYI